MTSQQRDLNLTIPDAQLAASWSGPEGQDEATLRDHLATALDSPAQYPPLEQAVVPGDRVVLAIQIPCPALATVLDALCSRLLRRGVEPSDITLLHAADQSTSDLLNALPPGLAAHPHAPDDKTQIAYLASSQDGHLIYLNRHLTDADVVVSVAPISYDPIRGYRGPASLVYPDLGGADATRLFPQSSGGASQDVHQPDLSDEVSWLLGAHFQVAVVPGVRGASAVIAGGAQAVRGEGFARLADAWTVRPSRPAALVLAGVGETWKPTTWEDVGHALEVADQLADEDQAARLVLVAEPADSPGPAVQELARHQWDLASISRRRLAEFPDASLARRLAAILTRHRVYLWSGLEADLVDDLGMIPLEEQGEVERLIAQADSIAAVSPADLVRVVRS